MVKKFKAVYCFELSNGPGGKTGVWFVKVKKEGVVLRGKVKGMYEKRLNILYIYES